MKPEILTEPRKSVPIEHKDRRAEFERRKKLIDQIEESEAVEQLNKNEYLLAVGRKSKSTERTGVV